MVIALAANNTLTYTRENVIQWTAYNIKDKFACCASQATSSLQMGVVNHNDWMISSFTEIKFLEYSIENGSIVLTDDLKELDYFSFALKLKNGVFWSFW